MIFWMLLALLLLLLFYLYIENNFLSKTYYKLFIPKLHDDLKGKKILFFSDTHFRERNSHSFYDQFIAAVEKEQPDLILFAGDIIHVNTSEQVIEYVKDFFFQINKVAPTYVVYGNHDLKSKRLKQINNLLKVTGVRLLDNEAQWISFGKKRAGFWLMGLNLYETEIEAKDDVLSAIDLPKGSKNEPKILLAHYPQYFESYLVNEEKRPDLVLSGHAHGGQVILPFVGGLFAPGQGFNPKYDFGLFTSREFPSSRLILTRGIGNSTFPFRINNRPELVVIEFD